MCEVEHARGPQDQPVENPRSSLLDGQILVLAAQDIGLIEEAQRFKMAAMLLVELVPLGCNFLVEFLTKLRVLGLLGIVRAHVYRVVSPLAMISTVAAKISGDK